MRASQAFLGGPAARYPNVPALWQMAAPRPFQRQSRSTAIALRDIPAWEPKRWTLTPGVEFQGSRFETIFPSERRYDIGVEQKKSVGARSVAGPISLVEPPPRQKAAPRKIDLA